MPIPATPLEAKIALSPPALPAVLMSNHDCDAGLDAEDGVMAVYVGRQARPRTMFCRRISMTRVVVVSDLPLSVLLSPANAGVGGAMGANVGALEENLYPLRSSPSITVTAAGCKEALRRIKEDVNVKAEENWNAKENAVENGRSLYRRLRMRGERECEELLEFNRRLRPSLTTDARAGCSCGGVLDLVHGGRT